MKFKFGDRVLHPEDGPATFITDMDLTVMINGVKELERYCAITLDNGDQLRICRPQALKALPILTSNPEFVNRWDEACEMP